ncbi:tRNA pseudouridine(55) synthase TruB [bacterium]|nr:tRNA pseudouridine(55) synthase TruB [bacterium]MBU1025653.1 tRNA pseudouridine(55) synthase TruB [bacterium]
MEITGFLNINKHPGPTSHDIVRILKRHLNLGKQIKIGHTGTLDPSASGVLVIGIGSANRLAEYILKHPKEYSGIINLGTATTSLDADGDITEKSKIPDFNQQDLDTSTTQFMGKIMQVPPIVSALKSDGERYYVKARRGETTEPPAREVVVYDLNLKRIDGSTIDLYVKCSSGFYVRSLARDIARNLNTVGHLDKLVRRSVGPFKIEDAINTNWIEQNGAKSTLDNKLYPLDTPMAILPRIEIEEHEAVLFIQGMKRFIESPPDTPLNSDLAIYSRDDFLGIAQIREIENKLQLKPKKVLFSQ